MCITIMIMAYQTIYLVTYYVFFVVQYSVTRVDSVV